MTVTIDSLRRVTFLALAFAIAAPLNAQQVQFTQVTRAKVKERFDSLPLTNPARAEVLRELFATVHCDGDRYQEQKVKGSKLPNLICTLPGSTEETVVVAAHYDKVEIGPSQGAVDNWSSASLLPTLYESLAGQRRRLTYVFIGFTDEEKGLIGSQFYVNSLSKESRSKIVADVNLDSIGMTTTKVWVSRADKELVRDTQIVAHFLKVEVAGSNVDRIGDSDSHPFANRNIPVIDFHSVVTENLPILHHGGDKPSAIDWNAYYDTYRLVAGLLGYLDAAPYPSSAR